MKTIVPPARPAALRADIMAFLGASIPTVFPYLVARRGYFGDSMGAVGENDINIYDDAIWIIERTSTTAFNANCDPGRKAPHMATLKPGRYWYVEGIHGLSHPKDEQYRALVQDGDVTVHRDDTGDETGRFGINIHCGGYGVTSSLGCQTIPPEQWGDRFSAMHKPGDFMFELRAALVRAGRNPIDRIQYILTSRY